MHRSIVLLLLSTACGYDWAHEPTSRRDPFPPPPPPPPTVPLDFDFGPRQESAIVPRPISGGTLLLAKNERTMLAAGPDRDLIWLADLIDRAPRAFIELSSGDEPGRGVEDDRGRAHIALRGAGSIVTLDLGAGAILDRRPVCAAP